MLHRTLVAVALSATVGLASSPAGAQVTGTYAVEGRDADQATYQGTVTITPAGENFRVVWRIGSETYNGTGLAAGDAMAVSYSWGRNTGVGLYIKQGDTWAGIWTTSDSRGQGTEVWRRR